MRKKQILFGSVILLLVAFLAGCAEEEITVASTTPIREIRLEELETETASEVEDNEWSVPENGSFLEDYDLSFSYEQLSDGEKIWYKDIAEILGMMGEKVKLSREGFQAGCNEKQIDRIFQYVLNDHPELFYVEGYSYTQYTRGDDVVAIEFSGTYNASYDEAMEKRAEIEKGVAHLLRDMPTSGDDYDKIKYLYEEMVLQTDYDAQAPDNQNIYSVFVGHASVCQGYAKAFQYLMKRIGVECALVQGKVVETGEGHAWNLVKADGDYYYVDPTWGDISYRHADADGEGEQSEEPRLHISYDYLCVTTKQLLRTHEPDDSLGLPECVANKDNYYVRGKAYFTEYDQEKMAALIDSALAENKEVVSIACAEENCYEQMCERLIENREIFDYLAGSGINSFVYSNDDKQLTLTFFLMTSSR